ncbi:hypothetical protein DYQ93_19785 [Xanthomonas sp. LMG 8992]|nr:hypothetical protein [Xanthomonas sp. LMG 8992]
MEDKLDRLLGDVDALRRRLERRRSLSDRAFWILEKLLVPLAIAILAFYGSVAADKIAAGQLTLARANVDDRQREFALSLQTKYVELFHADIASGDPRREANALALLRLMDPALAVQLADFVASNPAASPALQARAAIASGQLRRTAAAHAANLAAHAAVDADAVHPRQ